MADQRELDTAQLEAMLGIDKLFEEWRKDFLGDRDENRRGADEGGASPEDQESAIPAGY